MNMTSVPRFLVDNPQELVWSPVVVLVAIVVVYGTILNLSKLRRFLTGDPKTFFEVLFAVAGLVVAYVAADKNRPVVTVIGFFIALVPFLIIERLETRNSRKQLLEQQVSIRYHFDRIDAYLKASKPDRLTVAIFADLLIYLPMYVADRLGYLEEESISVDYAPKSGDEKVARAVASSEAHIGLCDPCMCAREEFGNPGNLDERLQILAPLVTKIAAKPMTRYELRVQSKLLDGGDISIATYGPPSTTFVMAATLKEELEHYSEVRWRPRKPSISLQAVGVKDLEEHLNDFLVKHDIVMLWDPLLTIAKSSPENIEFVPNVQAPPSHLMYSAVVISERLLNEKPSLGLRMFRALSRASFAIYLSVHEPEVLDKIVDAASSRLSTQLSPKDFRCLIHGMAKDGLFPLIRKPEQIHDSPEWRDQLHRALNYRLNATALHRDEFKERIIPVSSAEDCRQFFCSPETFRPIMRRTS